MATSKLGDNLWRESCRVGAATVDYLIDTGSQVTILPATLACATQLSIGPAPPQLLRAYGGSQVDIIGRISNAKIFLGNISHQGDILVTTDGLKPILGMDFLPDLRVVKVCTPLTCDASGFVASFRLRHKHSLDGMCYPARSLPFSMKALVEDELKRLRSRGVIYAVENPKVSAPIIPVVKQSGAVRPIRIYGDYSLTLKRIIDRLLHSTSARGAPPKGQRREDLFSFGPRGRLPTDRLGSWQPVAYLHFNPPWAFCIHQNAIWHLRRTTHISRGN